MALFIDLTFKRFGHLKVAGIGKKSPWGKIRWRCDCDCGRHTLVLGESLRSGKTKSCGNRHCSVRNYPAGAPSDKSWHADFLAMLAKGYTVSEAASNAGVCTATAGLHRKNDKQFAKKWAMCTPKSLFPKYPGLIYVKDACRELRCTMGCLFNLAKRKKETIEKKRGKGKDGQACRRSYVRQEFVDFCKEERKSIAGDSLSVLEVAVTLGISRRKVEHLIQKGTIKASKVRMSVPSRRLGKPFISIQKGRVISKVELKKYQKQQLELEVAKPQSRVDENGIVWLPRSLARAIKIKSWVLTYYSDNPCPYLGGRKLEPRLFDGLLHFKKKELETLALALRRRKFKNGRLLPLGEPIKIGDDTWYHGSLALKKFGIRLRGKQNFRDTVWLLDGRLNGGHGSKPLRKRPITWQKIPNPWASRPKEIVVYHEKDLQEIAARIKGKTRPGTFFPPLVMNGHEGSVARMAATSSIVTGSHQRERVRQIVVVDEFTPNALGQLAIGTVPGPNLKGLSKAIYEVMRLKDWIQENEFIQQVWGHENVANNTLKTAISRFNGSPDVPFKLSREDGRVLKIK